MIWWILNDGCFDYHNCTGPDYQKDPFVKKLVDAGTVVMFGLRTVPLLSYLCNIFAHKM